MLECFFLFLLILTIIIFIYYFNNNDVLCPSCLACFSFLMCTGAAIYNCWAWETGINLITVFTIISGLVSFVIPATLSSLRRDRATGTGALYKKWNLRIEIPKRVTLVVCLFGIVMSALYVRAIVDSVGMRSSWSETMQAYRWNSSFNEDFDSGISTFVNYGFRLFMAFGYVYILSFINELLVSKCKKWSYLLPPIIYCVASLGQSSRGQVIIMAFSGVLMFWVLRHCVYGKAIRINFGILIVFLIIVALGLFAFVASAGIVGRVTVKTPLDSLMTYVGGSIIGFDQFIARPELATSPDDLFGAETLRGIWLFLGKTLNVPEWIYSFQLEYRFVNSINIGNLYTAFRYYLHDFGFTGMCIVSALQGWLFGFVYQSLCNVGNCLTEGWRAFLLIIYAWLGISIPYLAISDYLFHQYASPTSLLTIAFMGISVLIIFKYASSNKKVTEDKHQKIKERMQVA